MHDFLQCKKGQDGPERLVLLRTKPPKTVIYCLSVLLRTKTPKTVIYCASWPWPWPLLADPSWRDIMVSPRLFAVQNGPRRPPAPRPASYQAAKDGDILPQRPDSYQAAKDGDILPQLAMAVAPFGRPFLAGYHGDLATICSAKWAKTAPSASSCFVPSRQRR